jgi:phosphoenolpyruvate carboxylase
MVYGALCIIFFLPAPALLCIAPCTGAAAASGPGSYAELDEAGRVALLTRELATPRLLHSPYQAYTPLVAEELGVVRAAADIHRRFGAAAVPNYIISNCSSLSDLLEVAVLLREAGLLLATPATAAGAEGAVSGTVTSNLRVNIIPLFETIEDLRNGAAVMDAAFRHPLYSRWIAEQESALVAGCRSQEVMLGYSVRYAMTAVYWP